MKYTNTDSWKYSNSLEGLLFFAQTIDEMLFDHTLDTYKVPALNTKALCHELNITARHIVNQTIRKGAILPLIEEFKYSIKNDPIAKSLIGVNNNIIYEDLSENTALEIIIQKTNYLISIFSDNKYLKEAQYQLKILLNNPTEKKQINRITRLYLTELINMGYHQNTIYSFANYIFFKAKKKSINSVDYIDNFFNNFNLKTYQYKIIYKGPKTFLDLRDICQIANIDIREENNPLPDNEEEKNFIKTIKSDEVFIICNKIEARDQMSAYQLAEQLLSSVSNFYSYYNHTNPLIWSKQCISLNDDTQKVFVISEPKKPMLKLYLEKHDEKSSISSCVNTVNSIKFSRFSITRLLRAIDLHAMALQSTAIENQLLDLWAAIETLIPKLTNIGKDRIEHICDSLLPFLHLVYIDNLISDLEDDIQYCKFIDYKTLISSINEGSTNKDKISAFIVMEKYNQLRSEIYSKLDLFPLLKNRIFYLNECLHDVKSIQNLIEHHIMRVRWHIMRIYRTRNEIIHNGDHPLFINILVENLHSYIDIILNGIINISNVKDLFDLEQIYFHADYKSKQHFKLLRDNHQTKFDESNYLNYIHISL